MLNFDFEEQRMKQEITLHGAKRVLLQMPQGLKPQAAKIAHIVESCGATPIISSDPCYGACDIALFEAEALDVDLIVHFGHVRMVKAGNIPVLYVEAKASISVDMAVLQALTLLSDYSRIGLATSVQHIEKLNGAKHLLSDAGKTVLVGNAEQLPYAGQVLGCNYSNATIIADEVEAFLFLGGGLFHALGIALGTSKPTIIADPYDNRAYSITQDAQRLLKQRFAIIQEAKTAKAIGILVGLKPGQKRLDSALRVKALANAHGQEAYLLAGRELTPEVLLEFVGIDVYVNTACPRISLDAPGKFQKPMLTVNEFMVACGEVSWLDMLKKGLLEN